MIAAFERANVTLFVAYYRRALPRFLKAKEMVDSGRLGRLRCVEARYASAGQLNLDPARLPWRVQAEHAGGGLFLDLASHTLDGLDFLLGPLLDVKGQAHNDGRTLDVEDQVSLEFGTASGARGHGSWSFTSATREDFIHIEGSDGSLRLATFGDGPVVLETSTGSEQLTLPNPRTIQGPMIQTVVDSLRGQGRCLSTGVSAARTSEVMDRALAGYYGARDEAFWKHPERWPGRRV
jgi:predicted dehydrogenase